MGGQNDEDFFETSDQEVNDENDLEVSRHTVDSQEETEAAWAKYQPGAKAIAGLAAGVMYMERYESFIHNKWPFDVKRGNLCHPRALALSGLAFHSLKPTPSVQCVVCRKIFINIEANSNPWILHSESNPNCLIVKLGQRDKADDYSLDQILEMAFAKIYNDAELIVKKKEKELKKRLCALRNHESAIALQNTDH